MAGILNEQEVILLFRNESTKHNAFVQILDAFQKRVYWHVRRIVISHDDADDVTQNTFIKVWENLENFREDSKLYTWIFRIATNEALGFLNKYEYQSHDNGTHFVHSFITNKVNITDINTNYHINADPASCCCCTACC
jgi:RNA polymerase sigma-70 factor (ECF subfamily)